MSIADAELGLPPSPPVPFPEQMEVRYDVPMTVQKRIRFEVALVVGHAGVSMDFNCYPQAEFELDRDGPCTIHAFIQRIDEALQQDRMEEECGAPIAQEVRDAIGTYVFSLDDGVARDVDFQQGPVSLRGRTICIPSWRERA